MDQQLTLEWLLLPTGAGILGLLAWRGLVRRGGLGRAPQRDVKLGFRDLVVALALMFVGFAAFMVLMQAIGWISPDNQRVELTPMQSALMMLASQLLTQFPPVTYIILRATQSPRGLVHLGIVPTNPRLEVYQGLLTLVVALPVVISVHVGMHMVSQLLDQPTQEVGHEALREFLLARNLSAKLLMLMSAVGLAPVLEEIIFRGLVQTALLNLAGRDRRWRVILFSAALFAAIHLGPVPWQLLPGLFVLGVAMGYLYEYTGRLLPCIVLHMGFNAANVALLIVSQQAGATPAPAPDPESLAPVSQALLMLLG